MDIPKKATKEQVKAMTETEGNIRVSSVPGSGKTFVLTYRIAYLITELFVEPSSIVALTFTNKAEIMPTALLGHSTDIAICFLRRKFTGLHFLRHSLFLIRKHRLI